MHGNHQLTLEEDSSKDGVANPAIELNDPINGVWDSAHDIGNPMAEVPNLILGVPDPKFEVKDLKTASK